MSTSARILLARLRSRWGLLLLLLQQAIFFNVIIPGHTRGAITLDGNHSGQSIRACCCEEPEAAESSSNQKKHAPSQRDRQNCAICNFAARVTPPPAISLTLPELGLLSLLPLPPPATVVAADFTPTYYGRGPPA